MSNLMEAWKGYSLPLKIHLLGCLLIIIGLFFSRAMMSIGMMVLVGASLLQPNLKNNFTSFLGTKVYLIIPVYALLLYASGIWSEDKAYFLNRATILLPFLVLPFSFYSFKAERKEWVQFVLLLFIGFIVLGNTYSLVQYWLNKEAIDASYQFSKVIPTPFKNDHIRYSMVVAIGCAFLIHWMHQTPKRGFQIIYFLIFLYFTAYLHILSVKSGLICYYLMLGLFLLYLFFSKRERIKAVLLLTAVLLLPILSYQFSSTFRTKIHYILYSISQMRNSQMEANVSDEGRLISYQYALDVIKQHPYIGVGLGDVYHEMDIRFKRDFPNRTEEPLLPHNQFLMVSVACGLFAGLLLVLFQWGWFKKMKSRGFLHLSVFLILLVGLLIEPLFETQYGACIYVFLILFLDNHVSNPLILKVSRKN